MDGIEGDRADVTLAEDAGLLDRSVGEVRVEVLAPKLDAAFDRVEVLIGFFVHVREDARADGGTVGVGVEDAEGVARRVARDGKGVAAGEFDAVAFFEGIRAGGLGRGWDPEGGSAGERRRRKEGA